MRWTVADFLAALLPPLLALFFVWALIDWTLRVLAQ